MRSLRLTALPCQEHQPLCPQVARPAGSIPICATVAVSECQGGTLTISWDKTEAALVTGVEVVQLPDGSYERHFEWVFKPLMGLRKVRFRLSVIADGLSQAAEYIGEV
jgi:hypothetical protein